MGSGTQAEGSAKLWGLPQPVVRSATTGYGVGHLRLWGGPPQPERQQGSVSLGRGPS